MSRPLLYISGPYTACGGYTVAENIEIAKQFAVRAWERGWAAICPHANTAHFEDRCALAHNDWLEGDLAIIYRLRLGEDAMLMLPGWENSLGADLEREHAIGRGLDVYYAEAGVPKPGSYSKCIHYHRYEDCGQKPIDVCHFTEPMCPPNTLCPIARRSHR